MTTRLIIYTAGESPHSLVVISHFPIHLISSTKKHLTENIWCIMNRNILLIKWDLTDFIYYQWIICSVFSQKWSSVFLLSSRSRLSAAAATTCWTPCLSANSTPRSRVRRRGTLPGGCSSGRKSSTPGTTRRTTTPPPTSSTSRSYGAWSSESTAARGWAELFRKSWF